MTERGTFLHAAWLNSDACVQEEVTATKVQLQFIGLLQTAILEEFRSSAARGEVTASPIDAPLTDVHDVGL